MGTGRGPGRGRGSPFAPASGSSPAQRRGIVKYEIMLPLSATSNSGR